jgi:hypothetical protein
MSSTIWTKGDDRMAAVYSSQEKVMSAKEKLQQKLVIANDAIKIIAPNKHGLSSELEGSSSEIGKSMLKVHLIYSAMGLTIGLMLAWLLVSFGPKFTQLNPTFTYLAMLSPGLFIGLFLSGLVSLKPQHDQVNQAAVKAEENKNWTLLVDVSKTDKSKKDIAPVLESTEAERIL